MDYIASGHLQNNNKLYHVRRLYENDLNDIYYVQNKVIEKLENNDTLQPLSLSEFEYILQGNGLMVGAFIDEELIAFRALLIPTIDEEHLGLYVKLEDKLEEIIYQEISVVHPSYRGNQLQQKLAVSIMEVLHQLDHDFTYVCATVAPNNIASLKDKFKQEMLVGALTNIYEGKLRYILLKKIANETMRKWTETKIISISNISEQKHLLQLGWIGFQLIENGNDFSIKYGIQG